MERTFSKVLVQCEVSCFFLKKGGFCALCFADVSINPQLSEEPIMSVFLLFFISLKFVMILQAIQVQQKTHHVLVLIFSDGYLLVIKILLLPI